MPVQDLTPQLRTRLSRVERAVGWFVILAALMMFSGFVFYVYHTANRKGWLTTKVTYYTLAESAAGIKVGDPVKLMGFDVGEVTRIDAQPPDDMFNVSVEFQIKKPYYAYLWTESSQARLTPSDFMGKRIVEVTKGKGGVPTHIEWEFREYDLAEARQQAGVSQKHLGQAIREGELNRTVIPALTPLSPELLDRIEASGAQRVVVLDRAASRKQITGIWDDLAGRYVPYTKPGAAYFLPPSESPALTERLESLVRNAENALPSLLQLTNQLAAVLNQSTSLLHRAEIVLTGAQPTLTNLAEITSFLTNRSGGLGEWLLPPELNQPILKTLASADAALTTANTNLHTLAATLNRSLENLANLTSNLNAQVQSNDDILSQISSAVLAADELMQGLQKHWFLRSAFKDEEQEKDERTKPPLLPSRSKGW